MSMTCMCYALCGDRVLSVLAVRVCYACFAEYDATWVFLSPLLKKRLHIHQLKELCNSTLRVWAQPYPVVCRCSMTLMSANSHSRFGLCCALALHRTILHSLSAGSDTILQYVLKQHAGSGDAP